MESRLGIHVTIISNVFVIVAASTGVLFSFGLVGHSGPVPSVDTLACTLISFSEPPRGGLDSFFFLSPPEGGLDLETNRQGAI